MIGMREELMMRLLFDGTVRKGDDCLTESKVMFDKLVAK